MPEIQIFENTFENGMNSDIDVKRQQPGTYRDAKNIEITGLGKFLTATNMRGNVKIADLITGADISQAFYILGAFDVTVADYNLSTDPHAVPSKLVRSMIVFCKLNGASKIFYITTNGGTFTTGSGKYDLTSVEYTGNLIFPDYGEMDAVVLGEGLHSEIYFTDNTNNIRKITCIVRDTNGRAGASGTAGTAFYWNRNEVAISLFRRFPQDAISINAVAVGGNLICGGYEVAYRYWDQQRNKYSTVSPFTNCVPIYPQDYSAISNKENIFGGTLNEATTKKITVSIAHTTGNAANYTHIQLIVAKFIDGTTTLPKTLFITDPIALSGTSGTFNYDYTGLTRESEVPTENIVVDNADINTAKTLTIKDNILFLGNVSYFNRQTPSFDPSRLHVTEKLHSLGNNGIFNPSVANVAKGDIDITLGQNSNGGTSLSGNHTHIGTDYAPINYNIVPLCTLIVPTGSGYAERPIAVLDKYVNNTYSAASPQFTINGSFVEGNIITITFDKRQYGLIEYDKAGTDLEYTWNTSPGGYSSFGSITYVVQSGDTPSSICSALVYKFATSGINAVVQMNNLGGGVFEVKFHDSEAATLSSSCDALTFFQERNVLDVYATIDYGVQYGIDTSKTGSGGYKNPLNTTNSKGYFREEVYRVPVTYVDKFGNWSVPEVIDMSSQGMSTPDWKFSSRSAKPIFDTSDSIQALGLNLVVDAGAGNHPDWAVGMLVLRAKRIKNILYQSPHIPIVGAMPNIKEYDTGVWDDGKATDGSWLPKKFSTGAARNLLRLDSFNRHQNNLYGFALQNNILDYNSALKGSVIAPPEYIFNNNGSSFFVTVNLGGFNIRIIDAAAFWMTPQFITRTSVQSGYPTGLDFGDINVSSNGLAFRADGRANYYWNPSYVGKPALSSLFASSLYFPPTGQSKIVNQYYAVRGNVFVTLYEYLAGTNTKMSKIIKYNDMDTVSLANRGQDAIGQRSILLTLQDVFGDGMFVTGNPSVPGGNPANPAWIENLLKFGNAADNKWFPYYWANPTGAPSGGGYENYRKSRFYGLDSDGNVPAWDGVLMRPNIVDDPTMPTEYYGVHAVCPIVNIELGLPDNRYGTIGAAHEFISTGAYVPITSTSQAINIDIFGGDCFISKYYYKVNDTHLNSFISEAIPSHQDYNAAGNVDDNHVQAVTDCAEVLGLYIESEVNTELSSDVLTYPVPVNNALSNYNTFFTYNYIFGYSAQNYLKSWFTQDLTGQLLSKLESRITISDPKVYQGNVEGFDTFRAASYYDMEETFGAITKLIRDNNNHVLCLQQKAVSDLQVGLKLLTDGAGTETVTYSTTVIDKPQFIISTAGCQHLKTVKQSDDGIFFADARLGKVFKIGQNGGQVSDTGVYSVLVLSFLNGFANVTDDTTNADLVGVYDYVNGIYILGNNRQSSNGQPIAYVFSDKAGFKWVDTIFQDFNPANVATPTKHARFLDFVFSNQNTYMLGRSLFYASSGNKTDIRVERMFDPSAPPLRMLGQNNSSSVQFVVNPMNGYEQVYNVFGVDSNARCDSVVFQTFKDNNTDNQTITETLSTVVPRQTLYELTIVRDGNGRKLRAPYVLANIIISPAAWDETTINNSVSVNKLFTKFVQSPRQI